MHRNIWKVFSTALFSVRGKDCDQPKYLSKGKYVNKLWHIHKMKYHAALKMNKIDLFGLKWKKKLLRYSVTCKNQGAIQNTWNVIVCSYLKDMPIYSGSWILNILKWHPRNNICFLRRETESLEWEGGFYITSYPTINISVLRSWFLISGHVKCLELCASEY